MMQQWTHIGFAQPWVFLLLLLGLPIWWWLHKNRRTRYPHMRMPSLASVHGITSWRAYFRQLLPWMRAIALIALVIALARPRLALQETSVKGEGIDIVLAIDLSLSMLAQDFKPNRLEKSKRVAIDFVDKRPFDRISVVAFSGETFTACPLTTDHDIVRTALANLSYGILRDGTAIGEGLATAINRIKDSEASSKVIVLLTDGVNTAGYLSPDIAAQIAQEFGVKIYTIGVGSEGEALMPVSKDPFGKLLYAPVKAELDEALLQLIAATTNGRYFRATSSKELQEIYKLIDQLEKTEIETTIIKTYVEKFRLFAILAAILLVLELVLRYTILRAIP